MNKSAKLKIHIEEDIKEHQRITGLVLDNNNMLKEIHIAIFGDKNSKGMKLTNDEMWEVFTSSGWATRAILRVFAGIGIITGAIIGIIELIKRMK